MGSLTYSTVIYETCLETSEDKKYVTITHGQTVLKEVRNKVKGYLRIRQTGMNPKLNGGVICK